MNRLAPALFDRRFSDLMEMGRAGLPGLAPGWTDHNAHDPGITLMELLAWVTEAQLYSLGRMRTDERAAYAALLGVARRGTAPARGIVWPEPADGVLEAAGMHSIVLGADTVVNTAGSATPAFRPAAPLVLLRGHVTRLDALLADGQVVDYTAVNAHGGPAFQPFGAGAGLDIVLRITFECTADEPLAGAPAAASGALWPIGIRADAPRTTGEAESGTTGPGTNDAPSGSLTATLVTRRDGAIPVRIASDTSAGLLRTGVVLLDLPAVPLRSSRFTLELRAPRGFERAPRLLRIAPNVLPIVQGRASSRSTSPCVMRTRCAGAGGIRPGLAPVARTTVCTRSIRKPSG